ncbi:sugar ABC transporter ATP-binding protein [Leucobacter soli]|uniref:Fructose import ATP-binding protein FruK n=3 Tax=Leucobacter soli TaxID=2812850 RepID=A0A916JZT1_9MICO|nr:Fructose import ATP-binding protein FruK [Leucobacter soli]
MAMSGRPQDASQESAVVELRGLTKSFGDQRALDEVELTLRHGQVTALIGENGSGKSTLIKCLTGVYQPDGGSQLQWGEGIGPENVVVVHQDLGMIPGLTIAENFGVGVGFLRTALGRVKWRKHNARVQDFLYNAGLDVDARTLIEDLTLAEQTIIAIERALFRAKGEVSLVILDEPTAALPINERTQVLETVRGLRKSGLAILYVSHHLDEIVDIGDRVVVLRAGQVIHDEPVADKSAIDLLTLMSGEQHAMSPESTTAAGTEDFLSVRGLRTAQLGGIDFDARKGEILGIVGALDSGTGDVCQAIAGGLRYRGEVRLAEKRLVPGSIRDRLRNKIFLVPSDRRGKGIIGDLDIVENIEIAEQRRHFPLALISRRGERDRVADAMEIFDIRPRDPRRKVGMLSGGNQQKVVLARCLAQRPSLMVLENPTQGVDPAARMQIRAAIRDAASNGVTVVLTDVDESEIAAVATRMLRLDSGVIIDAVG